MKKAFCLLFALLIAVSAAFAAGCAGSGLPAPDTTGEDESTVTAAPEDTSLPDGLPETDFGGRTFRIITSEVSAKDVFTEDHMTTDTLHDAVLTRNLNVEDRFKIKLDVTVDSYAAVTNRVSRAVKSGSDEYDLCFAHMVNGATLAQNNYVLPFEKLPYVDLSKPWWDADVGNGFSIRNNLMMLNGDISPTSFSMTSCLYFNKSIFDKNDLEYPYRLVREGKWTFDRLIEYTKDISQDMDGDGKISRDSDADIFGLTSYFLNVPYSFYYAAGGMLITKDENDVPYFEPQVERDTAIYAKIYETIITNKANFETEEAYELNVIKIFVDGRAMFYDANLDHSAQFMRDMDNDYGILPEPKFDESQQNYQSFVNGAISMICVPASVKAENREFVSIIIEALASEAYNVVTPALSETYLKRKMTRDAESADMIDIIVRHRVFDMAYVNMWEGVGSYVRDLLRQKSENGVASKLKSYTKQTQKKISNIVKAFDDSLKD
ncbi:MAG: carbohydrate ABC transporter substrate-binding protein [Clostridia bacterium]|nr:carbohydrate ABC transporter substrate-binding protein [Clostridia bacterium]